jgi:iron complex transport system ATP-binding protein
MQFDGAFFQLQATGIGVQQGSHQILRNLSLTLCSGECVAIVGPNGAGKSTLLKALAGLIQLQTGNVYLDQHNMQLQSLKWRAQKIAWLEQQADCSLDMTAQEVVELGRLPHLGLLGRLRERDIQAVAQAMQYTGCVPWANRLFSTLSGGEQQRVLLARAWATQASILLFDEPTTFLDPKHQHAIWGCLRQGAQSGQAVAAVLHDIQLALTADRLWVIQDGQIKADGQPSDPIVQHCLLEVFDHAFELHAFNRVGAEPSWVVIPRVPLLQ